MHHALIQILIVTCSSLSLASATQLARLRQSYRRGCEADLKAPTGVKVATGLMIAQDATGEELALGVRLLKRRAERAGPGNYSFASFLYDLSSERADAQVEELFFDYVLKSGNEELLRDFADEIMEITKAHVILRDVDDVKTAARIQLVIDLLNENPERFRPFWDQAMTEYFNKQVIDADAMLNQLESFRETPRFEADAIAVVTELMRPVEHTVADLRLAAEPHPKVKHQVDGIPALIAGLRLDQWIRHQAGLPDAEAIVNIVRRIGMLSQALTRH